MRRRARPALLALAGLLAPLSGVGSEGSLSLSLREALLLAMEHSSSLKVERLNPEIRRTFELAEQAASDPRLEVSAAQTWNPETRGPVPASGAAAGLSLSLPTGTSLSGSASASWQDPQAVSLDAALTQSLLQGGGTAVNLARLRQARLDTFASRFGLQGFAASLAAQVESAYWDLYLAQRQQAIYRESLALAERQAAETEVRIRVGKLAEIELAAAKAEVASRRDALATSEMQGETARQNLLLLINPPGSGWDTRVELTDQPAPPQGPLDEVRAHVELGQRLRPDLNQARLEVQRGDLELIVTRNGLLPKLDLVLQIGKLGTTSSLSGNPELSAGFSLEYIPGDRTARALNRRARLESRQAQEALGNLERLAESQIRSAYLAAQHTAKRVGTTATLRVLQEEKLRAETEKFRVGSSTSYLVAQAQRDLLASQLAEAQSAVDYLSAVLNLYLLEGSLLDRRGLSVAEAATMPSSSLPIR
jgi:outer membrane protein